MWIARAPALSKNIGGRDRRDAVLLLWGIICLAAAGPLAEAENTFDGTYNGKRTLTKGPASECPVEEDVSVIIHNAALTFTNSALQSFVIGFDPHPDGSFGEI